MPRRVGVLGTLVWDRFVSAPGATASAAREDWGGIAYSLAAFGAHCPAGWEIVPLIKVGADLEVAARALLATLPLASLAGIRTVPEPNNRVELRYLDEARRCERLTGGVPPWRWAELEPLVAGLDALYINFISGYELELPDAERLRDGFAGPIYADLHSLFLGRTPDGIRELRPLPRWRAWVRCFDAVQLNEDELATLAGDARDPVQFASAEILGGGTRLAALTLGARGAAYLARGDGIAERFAGRASRDEAPAPLRFGRLGVPVGEPHTDDAPPDPTGCGDVWGAAFVAALLGGQAADAALERANAAAARSFRFRGAGRLFTRLRGASETGIRARVPD